MNNNQLNNPSSIKNTDDEDLNTMGEKSNEDLIIAERRRLRENEITKKLGNYLLKGYCMLSDACPECSCILLRTPDRQLYCVGCNEIDIDHKEDNNEEIKTKNKKKDRKKHLKKAKHQKEHDNNISICGQVENKLKWAVDELTKSQDPNRINEMCTIIIKLTETIKALKEHEIISIQN